MTNEDKQQLTKLKQDTAEYLFHNIGKKIDKHAEAFSVDDRLSEYIRNVVENWQCHNLYEILAINRFFNILEKYTFDVKAVRRFIKFYEFIKFNGTNSRTRYKLTPIQVFQYANIYGLKDNDGKRLTRTAIIFVPRKFSKTTSAASMACYDLLFGDNNSQAYVGANSYQQAKICFDEIREIMRGLDPKTNHIRINREKIMFIDGNRNSFAQCLTSNAKTQDGLNASLVIMDEYAQARNTASANGADLKNTLTSSMGARGEPLTVIITTASDVVDGPFRHELDGAKAVLRDEIENDSIFASIFEPDADDSIEDPRTWRKVQPHIGITVQEDYYEKAFAEAQISAENMMVFKTKLLNIFTLNEQKQWIESRIIKDATKPIPIERLERLQGMVAIDLSEKDDFTAVALVCYDKNTKKYYCKVKYFFPKGAIANHPNRKIYEEWSKQGHLHLTNGDVIDYKEVVGHIQDISKHVTILNIGYDQWKSREVINMLESIGAKDILKPVGQTYGNFTAPVGSFEHGISTDRIVIDDNPINLYCFNNCVIDYDKLENCKPLKRSQYEKIDGAITILMCFRLIIDYIR